jgi:DNA-binding IclR family transcriptional regulator
MPRIKYAQHVLNLIGSSPSKCVNRWVLVEEISKLTGEPRARVDNALNGLLRRMSERGILVRKDGYYCLGS